MDEGGTGHNGPAVDVEGDAAPGAAARAFAIPLGWPTAALFVIVYSVLLLAGYALKANPAAITTIWPVDAVVLLTLALLPKRQWPYLVALALACDVAVTWLSADPGPFRFAWNLWFAVTHVVDGVVGAALVQRWLRVPSLDSLRSVVRFYVASAVASACGATLGVLAYARLHPGPSWGTEWLHWWASAFLGALTVVPVVLAWLQRWRGPDRDAGRLAWPQLIVLNSLLLVVTAWVFGAPPADADFGTRLPFAVFPVLGALALQGPVRWALLGSTAMIAWVAIQTNAGLGPFVSSTRPYAGLLAMQVFLALAAAMTTVLAIAASEIRSLVTAVTVSKDRYRREAARLRVEIERRQVLEQQRAAAERQNLLLATVVRHTRDFVAIAAPDGRVAFINDFGRRLIGAGSDALPANLVLADFIDPREHRQLTTEIMPALSQTGYWAGELGFRRNAGEARIPTHTEAFRIDDAAGTPLWIATVSRDITEQRRLEHALLDAVSSEQQKLGRDVHDGLGQELTGLSMMASAAAASLRQAGRPEAEAVTELAELARQAIDDCRAIAHGLSPVAFAAGGLEELLEKMMVLQRNSYFADARCEVIRGAPLRLDGEAVENLYRICQEAVTNARRHGRCESIHVTLDIQPRSVRLAIQDDGVGIAATSAGSPGMGLRIMHVRSAIIGAQLSIGPGPDGGTLVTCECPQPTDDATVACAQRPD